MDGFTQATLKQLEAVIIDDPLDYKLRFAPYNGRTPRDLYHRDPELVLPTWVTRIILKEFKERFRGVHHGLITL
jgi:hypothetical protein